MNTITLISSIVVASLLHGGDFPAASCNTAVSTSNVNVAPFNEGKEPADPKLGAEQEPCSKIWGLMSKNTLLGEIVLLCNLEFIMEKYFLIVRLFLNVQNKFQQLQPTLEWNGSWDSRVPLVCFHHSASDCPGPAFFGCCAVRMWCQHGRREHLLIYARGRGPSPRGRRPLTALMCK